MKKLIALMVVALALGPNWLNASVPASGVSPVPDRGAPLDGNGVQYSQQAYLGYKVFVATSATAIQLTNENGAVVANGQVHKVCNSSGTATSEFSVIFDSNTTSGITAGTVGLMVMPPLNRSTTAQVCSPDIDAQFSNGIIVLQSVGSGVTTVYWRPSGGGRN